jgi:hypothetical protein
MRPEYCEAVDEDTPCICGATKEGKDPVRGVCQARRNYPKPQALVEIVLTDRDTGEIVARTRS